MFFPFNRADRSYQVREQRGNPTVLFINRSYWPDAEATGELLTELCEDLAPSFDVVVIAGQPNTNSSGASFRSRGVETRHGVSIRRVRHTRFPKSFLPGRLINYLSFLIGAFWAAMWAKRPDIVVVETDPPLLCLIGWYLRRFRGSKLVVYLQDIHPDIGIALGKIRDRRPLRMLRRLMFRIYCGADQVIVLSRDMRNHVARSGVDPRRIAIIPNWIDVGRVQSQKQGNPFRAENGIDGQFLVMYSGNLGFCMRLEEVVAAAGHLRDRSDILFVLIGEGAIKSRLQAQAVELGLPNIRFLPYRPMRGGTSLSAADVHLVPLDERIASFLMPSKLYGVLASGTPLIAVAPEACELAEVTLEHDIGVVVPPGESTALAEAIENLADQAWDLPAMGQRARRLAESHYDRRHVTAQFAALLQAVLGVEQRAKSEEQRVREVPGVSADMSRDGEQTSECEPPTLGSR